MTIDKEVQKDADMIGSALCSVFSEGDTLRKDVMLERLYAIVNNKMSSKKIDDSLEYLHHQRVIRYAGPYVVFQPVK